MSQKSSLSFVVGIALVAGGVMAWSQWSDMKADEPVHVPTPPPLSADAKVLPYKDMVGAASAGYYAASQCPEILKNLFCYCGCDETDKHTSLLDCFTTKHGMDCEICTEEAVMAAQMKQDKKTLSEIQKAIDKKFMEQYPFERPTQALLRYRNRLGMVTPNAAKSDDGIKVKPGVAAGTCCKHAMANSEAK